MAYKIYTKINLADTTRDADQIIVEDLGYKYDLDAAKLFANSYIKKNFFHKDTELTERKDGTYKATDFCSYGETIIIEPINIS